MEGENGRVAAMKDQVSWEEEQTGMLKTVYKDGKLIVDQKLSEIREIMSQHTLVEG